MQNQEFNFHAEILAYYLCYSAVMCSVSVISNITLTFLVCLSVFFRDPSILDSLDLDENEREVLINNINRRLTPQAVKIRAGKWLLNDFIVCA